MRRLPTFQTALRRRYDELLREWVPSSFRRCSFGVCSRPRRKERQLQRMVE
jgi:hypothetical protein